MSPEAVGSLLRMRVMIKASLAVLPETASASFTLAIASRSLPERSRLCASWSGLPTSGRTASAFCAKASIPAAAEMSKAAHATAPSRLSGFMASYGLVEELLGADQPDLGDAEALGGGHHMGDVLVGDELVGAQVEFRLHRHRRGAPQAVVEASETALRAVPRVRAFRADVPQPPLGGCRGR